MTAIPDGNRLLIRILTGLLLVWIVVSVTTSQLRMSPTFDEQNHVTRGIAIWRTGDYRLCFHHPPLANILQGLPVAWLPSGFSTDMPSWKSLEIWSAAKTTIWSNPKDGLRLILLARLPVLLFTLGLALLIFFWSRELFGAWGGVVSLSLFAFDPNMLAHSGLATTDIPAACTIVLAIYLLRNYLKRPGRKTLILAGFGIGLALATKFTALILLPITALLLLGFALFADRNSPVMPRVMRAVGTGAVMLLVAGITLWAVYGFKVEAFGSKPGQPLAANASFVERMPIPPSSICGG